MSDYLCNACGYEWSAPKWARDDELGWTAAGYEGCSRCERLEALVAECGEGAREVAREQLMEYAVSEVTAECVRQAMEEVRS